MHAGLLNRPTTAGVAAVAAAGMLAATPLVGPNVQAAATNAASSAVNLTAFGDAWTDLFDTTGTNLNGLFDILAANPAPILTQVFANQQANFEAIGTGFQQTLQALQELVDPSNPAGLFAGLEQVFDQFSDGQFIDGFNNLSQVLLFGALPLVGAITPITDAIKSTLENQSTLVDTLFSPLNSVFLPLAILSAPVASLSGIGLGVQNIADAAGSGDLLGVAEGVFGFPATVTDAFLNGWNIHDGGNFATGGLIGAWDLHDEPMPGGTIATLHNILLQMAEAIGYTANPVPTAATEATSLGDLSGIFDQFGAELNSLLGSFDLSGLLGGLEDLFSPLVDAISPADFLP